MKEAPRNFSEYYPYLEDIRRRVYSLAITFLVFFGIGFFCANRILGLLVHFLEVQDVTVVTTSPFQLIDVSMSIGLCAGLIVCLPVAVFHLYGFIKDGLNPTEKKYFFVLLPISLGLFLLGFSYGFAILYFCLNLIAKININLGVNNYWDINQFLSQIIFTAALLGAVFQFPIVLTALVRVGVITVDFLKSKRRHAVALMFGLVAMLPPTDGLSLVIMVVPLLAIYEITILVNAASRRQALPNINLRLERENI